MEKIRKVHFIQLFVDCLLPFNCFWAMKLAFSYGSNLYINLTYFWVLWIKRIERKVPSGDIASNKGDGHLSVCHRTLWIPNCRWCGKSCLTRMEDCQNYFLVFAYTWAFLFKTSCSLTAPRVERRKCIAFFLTQLFIFEWFWVCRKVAKIVERFPISHHPVSPNILQFHG